MLQLVNRWTDSGDFWFEFYATEKSPEFVRLSFL